MTRDWVEFGNQILVAINGYERSSRSCNRCCGNQMQSDNSKQQRILFGQPHVKQSDVFIDAELCKDLAVDAKRRRTHVNELLAVSKRER